MTPLLDMATCACVCAPVGAAHKSRVHNNGGFAFMSCSSGSVLDLPFRLNGILAPTTAAQVQRSGGEGGGRIRASAVQHLCQWLQIPRVGKTGEVGQKEDIASDVTQNKRSFCCFKGKKIYIFFYLPFHSGRAVDDEEKSACHVCPWANNQNKLNPFLLNMNFLSFFVFFIV